MLGRPGGSTWVRGLTGLPYKGNSSTSKATDHLNPKLRVDDFSAFQK